MAVSFIGGENHRPVASHRQTLSHNVVSSTPSLSRIHNNNKNNLNITEWFKNKQINIKKNHNNNKENSPCMEHAYSIELG